GSRSRPTRGSPAFATRAAACSHPAPPSALHQEVEHPLHVREPAAVRVALPGLPLAVDVTQQPADQGIAVQPELVQGPAQLLPIPAQALEQAREVEREAAEDSGPGRRRLAPLVHPEAVL